jgi:hypothetical protein
MSDIHRVHAVLFDELERQGVQCVDIGKLTLAVVEAKAAIRGQRGSMASTSRCANGSCDE